MYKHSLSVNAVMPGEPRRSKAPRKLWFAIIALLLAPIVVEGAAIWYGQWREALGRPGEVHAPILYAAWDHFQAASTSLWSTGEFWLSECSSQPTIVLPIAGVLLALGIALLKT